VGNHFYLPEGKSEEALFKRVPFLHRVSELLSLSLITGIFSADFFIQMIGGIRKGGQYVRIFDI
jgi:hypothetical protein